MANINDGIVNFKELAYFSVFSGAQGVYKGCIILVMTKYSIVVPFHNEQESVTALYDRLKAVMEATGDPFELVFVDDGSIDRTYKLLREIVTIDSRVIVVKLRRNFGQTSALAAGFAHAQGEYLIAMDGDLQHDPDDIPKFLEMLEQGYDLVSGWRKERVDNFVMRRIPSRIANWAMSKLSGVNIHDFGTTYKAYRREIIATASAVWRTASLHSSTGFMVWRFHLRDSHQEYCAAQGHIRTMAFRGRSVCSLISSPSASC